MSGFPATLACSLLPVLSVRPVAPDANVSVISTGSYVEGAAWELLTDERVEARHTEAPCAHAVRRRGYFVVPRLVRAYNQGGFDCTAVCADCVAEAIGR